jgi:hypothetical protein
MRRTAPPRRLEEITIVRLCDLFLYVFRCKTEISCANDNVNVLDKHNKPGFSRGKEGDWIT